MPLHVPKAMQSEGLKKRQTLAEILKVGLRLHQKSWKNCKWLMVSCYEHSFPHFADFGFH